MSCYLPHWQSNQSHPASRHILASWYLFCSALYTLHYNTDTLTTSSNKNNVDALVVKSKTKRSNDQHSSRGDAGTTVKALRRRRRWHPPPSVPFPWTRRTRVAVRSQPGIGGSGNIHSVKPGHHIIITTWGRVQNDGNVYTLSGDGSGCFAATWWENLRNDIID